MVVRFDCFEFDAAAGELRKRGRRVRLRDQARKVLAALLEHPGEVVTRHELQRALWPDDFVVDFDNNLNTVIARLRQALGDSAERPRIIETVPRHGYRFVAKVSDEQPAPEIPPPPGTRLIVLPFVNLSGEPDQEYFSDAVTEEVIAELAALASERLGVIARTTAMSYKGTDKDVARIGRELGVAYAVEGGVLRDGDRLTVTAQLIRVSDQTHLLARRYDADVHGVFDIRSSIAEAVADRLEIRPGASSADGGRSSRRRARRSVDLAAWNDLARGRHLIEQLTPKKMEAAKRHFEAALERSPGFAPAHEALAEFYTDLGYFGVIRPIDAFSIGITHALAAVEADPSLAEAHAVLADYHKQLDHNWAAAEREMARALELDPASPIVRCRHAVATLMPLNRLDEAIGEIERALELDPLSPYAQTWFGVMFLLGRDYDRAIVEARRLLELEPASPWAHFILGCAFRQQYADAALVGKRIQELADQAIRAHRTAVELAPGFDFHLGWLGLALGVCGRQAEARDVLVRLQHPGRYILPTNVGLIHLGLGEIDAAFECFARAVEERDQIMMPILSYTFFDPLRDDPRYAELLRKMKLA